MVNEEQIVRDCLAWNLVIYSSRLMGYMRLSVIVTISLYEQLYWISCNLLVAIKKLQSQSHRIHSPLHFWDIVEHWCFVNSNCLSFISPGISHMKDSTVNISSRFIWDVSNNKHPIHYTITEPLIVFRCSYHGTLGLLSSHYSVTQSILL